MPLFTFTWSIENFSMCPQMHKQKFESPTFVVDALKDSEWCLSLYPKGYRDANFVACYLRKVSKIPERILLEFRIEVPYSFGDCAGPMRNSKHTFDRTNSGHGYPSFISLEDIKKKISQLDDTLTLQCVFLICDDDGKGMNVSASAVKAVLSNLNREDADPLSDRIYLVAGDKLQNLQQYLPSRCFARTRIEVDRRSVVWKIERFSSLISKQRSIPAVSTLKGFSSLILTIYVGKDSDDDDSIQIEISRNYKEILVRNFVRCKVTLLNVQMNDSDSIESEYYFKPDAEDDVWKLPTFIKIGKLFTEQSLHLKGDILVLRFEFSISRLGGERHVGNVSFPLGYYVPSVSCTGELNGDLGCLYKDGKFCDVTLCTRDRNFRAHRNVLCARSPVFSAMFESDMKEKTTGVVYIEDIGPDTLRRMLEYMYTDDHGVLDERNAALLYVAANKYRIASLRDLCSSYLISTLSVVNVCEVLTLADLHADDRLMKGVQNFMRATPEGCFHSKKWKKCMKNNPKLASEIMYKVFVEKAYF